jgi:cell division protein FtsN
MIISNAYSRSSFLWWMHSVRSRYLFIISFGLLFLTSFRASAQDLPLYDEISVYMEVPRVGGFDIDAVIKAEELYLPVTDLFDFLKIRNTPTPGLDSISGYFISQDAPFIINRLKNTIKYRDKTFKLKGDDLIRTESNLYLKSQYFGTIFGLDCIFNFRNLAVIVSSKLELPLIREMRQEELRKNLNRLKGEVKADTTVARTHPLFRFGMADWSAIGTEEINGKSETRLNLALGSMIAGGDATASLNYNSGDRFSERQQYYQWRYVNNDFQPLRQIMAGKITAQSVSTLFDPVIGVQFTNTPTTFRRSFGSYTLSDRTEPGWIVELYVNNVLVDYVKADASGFYKFEVPLIYGNSMVRLKFYGPWGEESTKEQNINIPFNFLPAKTMEYTVSAGIVEDTAKSRFSRASINYGLTRSITVGGGIEYLSSVKASPAMPFMNASFRVTNNLLLSGEYIYGVRAKSDLSWRLPSNLQFDINYTWYYKDQKAIVYNYREERKAMISAPVRIGNFSSFQRLTFYQIILPQTSYTTGEWLFSGSVMGLSTNLTTYALFISHAKPYLYSNLSLAFRLPVRFVIMPQVQYGYTSNRLLSAGLKVEKTIRDHAFLNLSLEQNFTNNLMTAEMGFRYDFSFAQTGLTFRQSGKRSDFVQYARGSIIGDKKTKYITADNRTNVGKGGITIIPYLDLNSNGKKDQGEPRVKGLNLHTNGGRVIDNERDTTIRILGLEPYTTCFIDLDPNSFDNISWRLPKKSYSVVVDPDILKQIEVPVSVVGEASGTVNGIKDGVKEGLKRIIIRFINNRDNLTAATSLTEENGYYSYFGLAPGSYYVKIDTAQLGKLKLISSPDSLQFIVHAGKDGDIIENLDFILTAREEKPDTTAVKKPVTVIPEKPVIRKDTVYMIIHEVTQETVTVGEDSYAIQLGAFRKRSNAESYRRKLEKIFGKGVQIVIEGDFYKVRIPDLKDRKEVDDKIEVLKKNGVTELWVITFKSGKQQIVLVEKQDTIAQIRETVIGKPDNYIRPESIVQVGAFHNEDKAIALRDRLAKTLPKPPVIVHEGGYYKVQITGLRSLTELKQILSTLGSLGLTDIWVPTIKKQEQVIPPVEEKPVIVQPDTTRKKPVEEAVKKVEIPPVEEKPAIQEPKVSLHVAIFHQYRKALKAQRRITSKLNLPVEIVKQWDYYHVLVTGFYTREETMKYYPELAGIGYPNITLIEKK